jgi:hypothetical protein
MEVEKMWSILAIVLLVLWVVFLLIRNYEINDVLSSKLEMNEVVFVDWYGEYALLNTYRRKWKVTKGKNDSLDLKLKLLEDNAKEFQSQIYKCPECNSSMQRFEDRIDSDISCCNEDCDFVLYADR